MKRKVKTLSYEQRCVFDKYIDFCKRVMCSVRYGGNIDTTPPKLIYASLLLPMQLAHCNQL